MDIAIISSSKDPAGINIRNNLIDNFSFKKSGESIDANSVFGLNLGNKIIKSYCVNSDLVHSEDIDKKIDADFFIFASKHQSRENTPSFAVHSIGNWSSANLGGREKTLVPTSQSFIKNFFIELNKNQKENFEQTMEATHHGPYLQKPSVFVEIGSTQKEWEEGSNGKIIADIIIDSIKNEKTNFKSAVGIGGPHYCSNFNKIELSSDIAFSFICPKYALEFLDESMIRQIMEKSGSRLFILDWKGLGPNKQRIINILDDMKIEWKRSDKV